MRHISRLPRPFSHHRAHPSSRVIHSSIFSHFLPPPMFVHSVVTRRPSSVLSARLAMFSFVLSLFLLVQFLNASPNPSRVDGDLLMRNWLFRPYLEVPEQQQRQLQLISIPTKEEQRLSLLIAEPAETEAELRRNRRVPLLRPSTRRLADQYTPTPCRWKLCASIFSGAASAFR